MKHVDVIEVTQTATPIPLKMDRTAKLLRWAQLVRNCPDERLYIFHDMERWTREMLEREGYVGWTGQDYTVKSALSIALEHDAFREQGLVNKTVAGIMQFFELSQAQLHEFSCDCGGEINNHEMADRIERLAHNSSGGAAPNGGFLNRMFRR